MTKWLIEGILGGLLVITIVLMSLSYLDAPRQGYDCRLAEISPDIPVAYKEACRRRK